MKRAFLNVLYFLHLKKRPLKVMVEDVLVAFMMLELAHFIQRTLRELEEAENNES